MQRLRPLPLMLVLTAGIATFLPAASAPPADQIVPVFQDEPVEWDPMLADGTARDSVRLFNNGQILETTLDLPMAPADQSDARRIVATLIVEPVLLHRDNKVRPADPWTRLGIVSLVLPPSPSSAPASQPATQPANAAVNEIELMRFITGFGGPGTFTQDVTSIAPLLSGKSTLRVSLSSFKKPAWTVTLTLNYVTAGVGYRRPVWAKPLFNASAVTAENSKLSATIDVPAGLARPRLRILSTGHASDGKGGDEFVSRTHVLRIDGIEVARWRPWAEEGGELREKNPMSGRNTIDGRELWSSDMDRSGWRSGQVVDPLRIPVPELTPGKHTIELEILGIRPKDPKDPKANHGYWRTSAVAVADEPWPEEDKPKE